MDIACSSYVRRYRIVALRSYRLSKALDGSSFVTHWVVAQKSIMREFVESVKSSTVRDLESSSLVEVHDGAAAIEWVWVILGAVRPEHAVQARHYCAAETPFCVACADQGDKPR